MAWINVDFAFYSADYNGSVIPEDSFPEHVRDAEAFVNQITFGRIHKYDLREDDLVCVKNAICAVAEFDIREDKRRGKSSESNDGYSVSYVDSTEAEYNSRKIAAADMYLFDTTLRSALINYKY